MLSAVRPHEPIAAAAGDVHALRELEHALIAEEARPALVTGAHGETVALPAAVVRALREIVQHLARDQAIAIVPIDRHLTTQQAADLLNMSRPYLITLLERGDLPYTRTGTHRRIRLTDLLKYKERRDRARRQTLADLTRLSDELGLYE